MHIEKRNLPLADDVTVESIALPTTGFTGADLANLVNEAALLAGRKSHSKVTREDFDAAILRAMAGIEKKRSLVKGLESRPLCPRGSLFGAFLGGACTRGHHHCPAASRFGRSGEAQHHSARRRRTRVGSSNPSDLILISRSLGSPTSPQEPMTAF